MYAIIETGGKQYQVEKGAILDIELIDGTQGETASFDKVLLVVDGDKVAVGKPYLPGAKVTGKIVEHGKGPKVINFKYKRKVSYHRTVGHRQLFTKIQVEEIKHGT